MKSKIFIYLIIYIMSSNIIFADTDNIKVNNYLHNYILNFNNNFITQKMSLNNIADLYCNLLSKGIDTSHTRIIIMLNIHNGRLFSLKPSKRLIRGKHERWFWHVFLLFNKIVYDFRFKIKPCYIKDYFKQIWNDKDLKNYTFYAIQLKDLPAFTNIIFKQNKIALNYLGVNANYLMEHPYYISKKKQNNAKTY